MRNNDHNDDNFNFPGNPSPGGPGSERQWDATGAGDDGDGPEARPALWEAGLGALMSGHQRQKIVRQGFRRLKRKVVGFFVVLILLAVGAGWIWLSGVAAGAEGAAPKAKEPAVAVEPGEGPGEEPGADDEEKPSKTAKSTAEEDDGETCKNGPRIGKKLLGFGEIANRAEFDLALFELGEGLSTLTIYGCWFDDAEVDVLAEYPALDKQYLFDTLATDLSPLEVTSLRSLDLQGSYDVEIESLVGIETLEFLSVGVWPGSLDAIASAPQIWDVHVDGTRAKPFNISSIVDPANRRILGEHLSREPGA